MTPILPPELLARGPIVIGATGGSGTRVLAKIIRDSGVYTGRKFTYALDSTEISQPSLPWIDKYIASEMDGAPPLSVAEMAADLRPAFEKFVAPLQSHPDKWGWKAPRSIYLLPFFAVVFPALHFIHVVRDGRDMAFSTNQNQLRDYGATIVKDLPPDAPVPVRAIALWTRVNLSRAEFAERELGARYLRIRFEDLCARPVEILTELLRFIDASGDANAIAEKEVSPPPSIGRWRTEDRHLIEELNRIGAPALRKFGYE
jgi:hypothetical protein